MRRGVAISLVPIAAAMALLSFCLAGARLYASSSGSAAFGDQVAETCRSDSAMNLPVPSEPRGEAQVREIGAGLVHVDAPRRNHQALVRIEVPDLPPRRLVVFHIDGVERVVTPALEPLGPFEVAVSRINSSELAVEPGDVLLTDGGQRLRVTQVFDDIPNGPVPEYWCGWRELFELTIRGDPPPPSVIASPETIEALGAFVIDEYRVTTEPLTISEARATRDAFDAATDAWESAFAADFGQLQPSELGRVVQRSVAVTETVERSLAPVLLTAVVAVSVVLVAASVLLARARRRELRLLAVRGVPPWRIAAGVAAELAVALLTGASAGAGTAYLAVRSFGPSSLLEPAAVTRSALTVAGALAIAVPFVALVVGTVADRYVDRGRRRIGAAAAVALIVVALTALAVVAFRRLDRDGGIRTFGVESRGGSLLSLGFPLFALLSIVAAASASVVVLARPMRLTGSSLPRALRLGWRRVVLEAPPLGAIVAAVALAAGCLVTANSLAEASRRQLDEKAAVYVGADLSVIVYDVPVLPSGWAGATSLAGTSRWREGGESLELLGVDVDTFGDVATLRHDASGRTLDEMLAAIDADGTARPAPAIAVGADARVGDVVEITPTGAQVPLTLDIVEVADFFPSKTSGATLYVVDGDVMADAVPFPIGVLFVRDPPDDAVAALGDLGVRTGISRELDTAFDGSAYSALRWAYAPLAVLGGLFAVVALALQLLVVAARTTSRRATHAIMSRTGFGTRQLFAASAVECVVPLLVGAVIGIGASLVAGSLGVPRLDPMPSLQPPARFPVPWTTVLGVAAAVPLWAAAVAALITRLTVRADPMEVLHGEL